METILIAGGAGFIGSHRQTADDGFEDAAAQRAARGRER